MAFAIEKISTKNSVENKNEKQKNKIIKTKKGIKLPQ